MAEKKLDKGVDPNDPEVIAKLEQGKDEIEKKYEETQIIPEAGDMKDSLIIGGFQARPLSAGIFALLEMIEHPMFADEADEDDEPELPDMMILFYLMLAEENEETFVDIAIEGGYKAMKKAALCWSFKLDSKVMNEMTGDFNKLMEMFNETMDLYAGTPGGTEEKK